MGIKFLGPFFILWLSIHLSLGCFGRNSLSSGDSLIINKINEGFHELREERNSFHWTMLIVPGGVVAAGVLAFLSAQRAALRQSKASTVSQFRQKWIYDLTEQYCICHMTFQNVCHNLWADADFYNKMPENENWNAYVLSKSKIKLLLNLTDLTGPDKHHSEFWIAFEKYILKSEKHYSGKLENPKMQSDLKKEKEQLDFMMTQIVRTEWKKLKRFE